MDIGFYPSCGPYYGHNGHIQGGHEILHGDYFMGPTRILNKDLCSFGLHEHINSSQALYQPNWSPNLLVWLADQKC